MFCLHSDFWKRDGARYFGFFRTNIYHRSTWFSREVHRVRSHASRPVSFWNSTLISPKFINLLDYLFTSMKLHLNPKPFKLFWLWEIFTMLKFVQIRTHLRRQIRLKMLSSTLWWTRISWKLRKHLLIIMVLITIFNIFLIFNCISFRFINESKSTGVYRFCLF